MIEWNRHGQAIIAHPHPDNPALLLLIPQLIPEPGETVTQHILRTLGQTVISGIIGAAGAMPAADLPRTLPDHIESVAMGAYEAAMQLMGEAEPAPEERPRIEIARG